MSVLSPVRAPNDPWNAALWPTDAKGNDMMSTPVASFDAIAELGCDQERPFETLIYEVLSILIQEEEKATVILRDAVSAEKQWQKLISDRLEKEHTTLADCQWRNNLAQKASDLIIPLSLVAGGVGSMVAASSVALLPLGAVALGGLMALDSIFDNRIKKQVASWFARGDEEETKTWFQRICFATTVLSLGLNIPVQGTQIGLVATNASRFAVDCAHTGTEHAQNQMNARLAESEREMTTSGMRLKELFGDIDFQVSSVNNLFTLLTDYQRSTSEATSRIFQ